MADATKVLATRNFGLRTAPWASSNAIPADTVVYGASWGGTWTDPGYTDGGINFVTNVERGEIAVDQELDPVLRPATGRDTRISTNLAEFTAANILLATQQGAITTVAAGSGTRGHTDWDQDSDIDDAFLSVGVEIKHQDGEAARLIVWKAQPVAGMSATFNGTDKSVITFEAAAVPDTSTSPARIAKFRDILPALP